MRKTFFLFLFLYQTAPVTAQDTSIIIPVYLLADFDILTTTLRENHPVLGAYMSRDSFDRLCKKIIPEIDKGMSRRAFHASVSHLLQAIGCGHTYPYATMEVAERLQWENDLPFEVEVMDTSIYFLKNLTPDFQTYSGAEVASINGMPVAAIIDTVFKLISSDGYNTTYKAYKFQHNFNYFLHLVLGSPDSLLFQTTAGKFTVRFPTLFIKLEAEEEETSFKNLEGVPHSVMLHIPDFDDGKGAIRKCFKYLAEHQTKNLVVDLRDNGGGNGGIGAYLMSFVMDTTLTYYLDMRNNPLRYKDLMKKKEGFLIGNQYIMTDSMTRSYFFKIKPKAKYHFDGHLYVLTNGGTFSTGSFTASALKHISGATCIGTETGGSAYAIGGGVIRTMVLPYTGLQIRFPMYRWRFNVITEDLGTGVIPDKRITGARLDDDSDPELEAVRKMILAGWPEER